MGIIVLCTVFAVYILASILVMRQVAVNERAKGIKLGRQACEQEHNATLVAERARLLEDCDTLRAQLNKLGRQLAQISPKAALLEVYQTVRDEITRIEQQLRTASSQYAEAGWDTKRVLNYHWGVEKTREHVGNNNNVRTDFETNVFPALSAQLEAARKRLVEIAAEAALDTETDVAASDVTKA